MTSRTAPLASRWLVNPRYDLTFFIGSVVGSFAVYGFHRLLVDVFHVGLEARSGLITFTLFTGVLDAPHIFQTFSRTHADSVEFRRHHAHIVWGLVAFLVLGEVGYLYGWFDVLLDMGAAYGVWHILAQNVGFLKIYKGLQRDTHPWDNRVDAGLLYTIVAAGLLGQPAITFLGPSHALGHLRIAPMLRTAVPWLQKFALAWFCILLAALLLRQAQRRLAGHALNTQKLLFLGTLLPFYGMLYFGFHLPTLVYVAVETTYHDLQYQGWVRFYQARRFPAQRSFRSRWLWGTLAIGSLIALAGFLVDPYVRLSFMKWDQPYHLFIEVPYFMIVAYHYYIDGIIWRLREAPELRKMVFAR